MKLYLAFNTDKLFNTYLAQRPTGGTAKLRDALRLGASLADYYRPEELELFSQANFLQSFYYINRDSWIPNNLSAVNNFLCDSGIFSIIYGAGGGQMDAADVRKYADAYADYVQAFNIQHYFELDMDGLIGEIETLKLRDRLESRVGWQTIPVWHINRGKQGWLRDLDHPYVAIAGLANCHGKGRRVLAPIFPWLVREAHNRGVWVHALGYTDLKMLESNAYNFDSVDSSSWCLSLASGTVSTFNGQTIVKYKVPEGKRMDSRSAYIQTFRTWIQYSRMLDNRYPNTIKLRPPQGWEQR